VTNAERTRPPRVLSLARSYPNNVFETQGLWTERPARHLARLCELHVISPVPYCPPLPRHPRLAYYTRFRDVVPAEVRDGIHVYHPRFPIGPGTTTKALEPVAYRFGIARLVRTLSREARFDLIHAHFAFPDGVVARALSRSLRIPYVITEHAPWHSWWLGDGKVRDDTVAAARDAAAVAGVSRYVRRTILDHAPEARVLVIPIGVEGSTFALGPPLEQRAKQIAFVGFISAIKGVDVLVDAMASVVAEEPDARLVIVGDNFYRATRFEEEEISRRAEPLVGSGHVEFVGRKAPDEVASIMRSSSVLVLPSQAETFGAVLVEALACGTPVVATRSGGPEDIVTPELGRLVDYGDARALAAALLEVLRNRQLFLPERLREHALREWNWAHIADRYYDLYCEVLSEHAAVTPSTSEAYQLS